MLRHGIPETCVEGVMKYRPGLSSRFALTQDNTDITEYRDGNGKSKQFVYVFMPMCIYMQGPTRDTTVSETF